MSPQLGVQELREGIHETQPEALKVSGEWLVLLLHIQQDR
jgi:hypothetical protein